MADGAHVYRNFGSIYTGHEFVNHGAGGRPSVHNNTVESLNALIGDAKFWVLLWMNRAHLHRYWGGVTFRWNESVALEIRGSERPRSIMVPRPSSWRAEQMFRPASRRQIRRSANGGIVVLLWSSVRGDPWVCSLRTARQCQNPRL